MSDAHVPIDAAMERYTTWVAANVPRLELQLRPGATPERIDEFARSVGLNLPDDFVALYRLHDGQSLGAPSLFPDMQMLPLDAIRDDHALMAEMQRNGDFEDATHDLYPMLKNGWTDEAWIPFAANGSGDHLYIDLDPGPDGTWGQVFFRIHDDSGWQIESSSLGAWLTDLVERIEAGEQPVTVRSGCTNYP